MEYGFTLHSIRRKGEDLPIGQVQEFTNADFKDMLRLGAVREPTADEMKLYKLAHPDEVTDLEDDETGADDKTPVKGKGKAAAAKAPAKPKTETQASSEGGTPAAGEGGEGDNGALV